MKLKPVLICFLNSISFNTRKQNPGVNMVLKSYNYESYIVKGKYTYIMRY